MICMPCVTWWYSGFPNKLCNVTWGETILKYEKCLQNMNKLIIFHLLKKKKKKKRYGHHILTVNLKSEIKIFKKSNFSWNLMRTLETTYSLQMLYKMCLAWWFFSAYISQKVWTLPQGVGRDGHNAFRTLLWSKPWGVLQGFIWKWRQMETWLVGVAQPWSTGHGQHLKRSDSMIDITKLPSQTWHINKKQKLLRNMRTLTASWPCIRTLKSFTGREPR